MRWVTINVVSDRKEVLENMGQPVKVLYRICNALKY